MGSFGWHNAWPFEWGGGPTLIERHYLTMRKAVGVGGAATEEETIEDIWRQRKAIKLAAFDAFAERAFFQWFPNKATDAIPYYEDLLGQVAAPDESEEARRQETAAAFTAEALADNARIQAGLKDVDSRLSTVEQPHSSAGTTFLGRAFEPFAGTPDWDSGDQANKSTNFPNFSDDFIVTVLFSVGPVPSLGELDLISRATRFLNTILPAWVGFRIITSTGFILDQSPLDITGFGL